MGTLILVLLAGLLFAIIEYSVFPLLFARFRIKELKTISANHYWIICLIVNAVICIAVNSFFYFSTNGSSGGISFLPCFFWTSIFSATGQKILKGKNLLVKKNATDTAPVSNPIKSASATPLLDSVQNSDRSPSDSNNHDPQGDAETHTDAFPVVMYCRICGARLSKNAIYCKACGTRIETSPGLPTDAENPLTEKRCTLEPPASKSLPTSTYNNTENTKENNNQGFDRSIISSASFNLNLRNEGVDPKLRRAFIFLEDEDWAKANDYLESALDNEPENAYAYLGKLLIDLKIDKVDQLIENAQKALNNSNYKKALRYAEGNLKLFLESLCEHGPSVKESSPEEHK